MIALDTNALLRWLFDEALWPDDDGQVARIRAAVAASGGAVYLNDVVLAESVWVMRSRLGLGRAALAGAIRALLTSAAVEIDRRSAVSEALMRFEEGGPGLVDHLIAVLNRDAACRTTLTFDRAAARAPGFTAIP